MSSARRPRERYVARPASNEIATHLTRINANKCAHGEEPCYLRCGVRRRRKRGIVSWVPIPTKERIAWLEEVDPQ